MLALVSEQCSWLSHAAVHLCTSLATFFFLTPGLCHRGAGACPVGLGHALWGWGIAYLQHEKAPLAVRRAASSAAASVAGSVRGDTVGYTMSEGSSPRGDAASTVSGFTAASAEAIEPPPPAALGAPGAGPGHAAHRRAPSGGGVAGSSGSDFGEIEPDGPPAASNNGADAAAAAAAQRARAASQVRMPASAFQ